MDKIVKQEKKMYKWNPTLELVGYVLSDTNKTIRNKDKRIGRVSGKLDVIYVNEQVKVYKDNSKFVKIFLDSNALGEFIELSSAAQRLMNFIINRLEYNQDYFYYIGNIMARESNIDESRISTYINELVDKEWIFRSDERGKYWINLCYICIGDRDELYRKYKQAVR